MKILTSLLDPVWKNIINMNFSDSIVYKYDKKYCSLRDEKSREMSPGF